MLADFPCVPILISLVNMVSELDLSISALEVDELATLSVYKKLGASVTLAHEQQKNSESKYGVNAKSVDVGAQEDAS